VRVVVRESFEEFVVNHEGGLRRALVGHLAPEMVADAVAEALAYAWEHWERVGQMACPAGYLFRVAQSRSRGRRDGLLPGPDPHRLPDVEPRLGEAMRSLPERQRSAVWLVHGCGWTYAEVAEALEISPSAVGTHLQRGMSRLRVYLGAMPGD
jgi:RNA polymerase sigma-70 factor (ECF subfamily)